MYTRVFGILRNIGMMRVIGMMRGVGIARVSSVITRMIQMILSCRRGVEGEERKEGQVKGRKTE